MIEYFLFSGRIWFSLIITPMMASLGVSDGKESTGNVEYLLNMWRHVLNPWVRKILWRRKWQPALVFLPGKSHGQSSLVGYSSQGCKESDRTQKLSNNLRHWPLLLRQDFLEERAVWGSPRNGFPTLVYTRAAFRVSLLYTSWSSGSPEKCPLLSSLICLSAAYTDCRKPS